MNYVADQLSKLGRPALFEYYLTLSHPEALGDYNHLVLDRGWWFWTITKGVVLDSLREKGLRKRHGQIDPVNHFPPRGSPLMIKTIQH